MTQRERIIEQAMQMFVTQGIKSVRMDDIAQQLGISKRTLYEQFTDKEGLLYLAMVCYFERNCGRWTVLSEGASNVLEGLFMVLRDVMDQSDTTNRMMDTLKKFYPAVYDKLVKEGSAKNRANLRELLEKGIADGFFIRNFNIDLAISVLYYTSSAIVSHRGLILPEDVDEREAFVQIVSTFFRGIATAEGLHLIDDYRKRYTLSEEEK